MENAEELPGRGGARPPEGLAPVGRGLKRNLLIVAAVAVVIAGGIVAVVTANHSSRTNAGATAADKRHGGAGRGGGGAVSAARRYLGVTGIQLQDDRRLGQTLAEVANQTSGKSAAGLIAAMVTAGKTQLDAEVAAGTLKPASRDAVVGKLTQRVTRQVNRVPNGGRQLAAAETYLGLTATQIRDDLRSGKTLAAVADSTSGKSAAGLIAAMVAVAKAQLDARVKAGTLARSKEQGRVDRLNRRVTAAVNHSPSSS